MYKEFVFTCFIAIGSITMSCSNDLEEAKKVSKHVDANTETGTNVVINYSEYGKPRAKLIAKELVRVSFDFPKSEFPKGLELLVYGEDGHIETTLRAANGSIDETNKMMNARNNVEVINARGDKLNTEELIWNQTDKKIYSNAFVKITTAKEIIMGDSMVADERFTDYTIKKVTGTVKVTP
jgi:LPS export ABC transporter protein LptC